jgi:hypothetical protein
VWSEFQTWAQSQKISGDQTIWDWLNSTEKAIVKPITAHGNKDQTNVERGSASGDAGRAVAAAVDGGGGKGAIGTRADGSAASEALALEAERQQRAIATLYATGRHTVSLHPERSLPGGEEHRVEISADGTRVIKHTLGVSFGVTLAGEEAPFVPGITLREATAAEYLDRHNIANEFFGTNFQAEGVSKVGPNPGLVISQTFMQGAHPAQSEIDAKLRGGGWIKLRPDNITNTYIEDKAWYHPVHKIILGDTKPDNFIKDAQGRLVPIDPLLTRVEPGTVLARAVAENMRR